jgi:hypothetical protein
MATATKASSSTEEVHKNESHENSERQQIMDKAS